MVLRSDEAKAKLVPALKPGNVAKVEADPMTLILAFDLAFFKRFPELFPENPNARIIYESNEKLTYDNAFRNGTLQGAWLIMAARSIGLDVGPMSGFDNKIVDEAFFGGTTLRSNFICNLGYADESKLAGRYPRLAFEEVTRFI